MKHNRFFREKLVDVALGKLAADLVIQGGQLVNVLSGEIHRADVVIWKNRIASINTSQYLIDSHTRVINAKGKYIAPGLIDPHMHLESSHISVTELAKHIVPRGVTSVVEDPHEIANVLGIDGIKLLRREAKPLPLRFFIRVPGRVPAIDDQTETSGAHLSLEDTQALLIWEEAVQLAGDINYELIIKKDREQLDKIDFAIQLDKTVGGQSPGLRSGELNAFIAAGPEDSHVSLNLEEAIDILRHGLRPILRHQPFLQNTDSYMDLAQAIDERKLDTRRILLCTDDLPADFLYEKGHLDEVLRRAIAGGIRPLTAYQMATINVAEHLRLDRDLGSVSPGKLADLILLDDLNQVKVSQVIADGKLVADQGRLLSPLPAFSYPDWSKDTIHLKTDTCVKDLSIKSNTTKGTVLVRTLLPGVPSKLAIEELAVLDGSVMPDQGKDVLAMAVLDRHSGSGRIGKAFIKGTGIKGGAIAGSYSHDAHNVFAIASNYSDMALAIETLRQSAGGYVAVKNGHVLEAIKLPIAGIMTDEPLKDLAKELTRFQEKLEEELQCVYPLFLFTVLTLPNIPEWAVTDWGLIEVETLKKVNTIV